MRANELRIGNMVEAYLEPQISEWIEMEVSINTLQRIEYFPTSHGYRPIPLTEEWLVRFGFDVYSSNHYCISVLQRGKIHVYLATNFSDANVELGNISGYTLGYPKVKHVHQLMNLYFALTGEELTIKE